MADYTIQLDGAQALLDMLNNSGDNASAVLSEAITEEAEVIFARSQILTPIDTGALRGSGGVSSPVSDGSDAISVDIFYGGPAAPYAKTVHELVQNRHNAPTQAKYLEQPFLEALPEINANIATRIKDMIAKESR